MCMATTGFGAQAARHLQVREVDPATAAWSHGQMQPPSEPYPAGRSTDATRRYTRGTSQPHFDMELRGLFSEDDLAIMSPVYERSHDPLRGLPRASDVKTEQFGAQPASHSYALSQQQNALMIDPLLQMSPPSSTTSTYPSNRQLPDLRTSTRPAQMELSGAESLGSLDFLDEYLNI